MSKLAIVYGTTEGQTAKIAQHIAAHARQRGLTVDVVQAAEATDDFQLDAYDAVMIGASVHEGHHQRSVMRWVKAHRDTLAHMPTAWFSVCLAIGSIHDEEREEARKFPQLMTGQTGFTPTMATVFAGALKYTHYSWLKRMVMKQISKHEGGSTDTSQDHEYTDWIAVNAFADAFLDKVSAPPR